MTRFELANSVCPALGSAALPVRSTEVDLLIVGSGFAGLRAAIAARDA